MHRSHGNQYVGRVIQAKLAIGTPGDSYEQEADSVADMVMRSADPNSGNYAGFSMATPRIQRMCAECNDELRMQPIKEKDEERRLQRKEGVGSDQGFDGGAESNVESVRSSAGNPLPEGLRGFFESRFGEDFSNVAIHSDDAAAKSAAEIGALAYTVGRDIVFGAGEYQPESSEGQRLIAHELTHVVQQGGSTSTAQRSPVRQRSGSPMVHGSWTHNGATGMAGGSASSSGNGDYDWKRSDTFVSGDTVTWQSKPRWQWCVDGGTAALQNWRSVQYTFTHDGADNDFLELTMSGSLFGTAKAEDLHYGKSGAAVVGLIKVRTPSDPTPPSTKLFDISDGGKSSANVSSVADIELTIPVNGTARVKIPLKVASEGELSSFSETLTPPLSHDVAGRIGAQTIVDLYLGAEVEMAADVESTCGLLEGSFDDVNRANAWANWSVTWRNRAAPAVVPPTTGGGGGGGGTGSGGGADVGIQARRWGCTNVLCNVQQIDKDANCPPRVRGDSDYIYSNFDDACDAAKDDANSKVPRGCYKRHCDCNTKCSQK
jgi:hypothetical protein